MKILVTGSAGHLGEGLMRVLRAGGEHEVVGVDVLETPFTTDVGMIQDRDFLAGCMRGVDAVIPPATLHKPHVATHSKQDFVDTNIVGETMIEAVEAASRASRQNAKHSIPTATGKHSRASKKANKWEWRAF